LTYSLNALNMCYHSNKVIHRYIMTFRLTCVSLTSFSFSLMSRNVSNLFFSPLPSLLCFVLLGHFIFFNEMYIFLGVQCMCVSLFLVFNIVCLLLWYLCAQELLLMVLVSMCVWYVVQNAFQKYFSIENASKWILLRFFFIFELAHQNY
jgi:hypothetical protein